MVMKIIERLLNNAWVKGATIRAVKTFFQTLVATISTATLLNEINWKTAISASILAFVLSVCTSMAGIPEEAINADN